MRWLFIALLLLSCSENKEGSPAESPATRSLGSGDSGGADVFVIDWVPPDAEIDAGCCGPACHCGDEYERQLMCWKTQLFYCTPDGGLPGDDPALYQQEVILDICNEAGEPCTPTSINDPDCVWEVIDIGDCEDWLECDPTDPDHVVNEGVPCAGVDEDGQPYTGFQDYFCQKGQIVLGPCVPCFDEVCDGLDNDCDEITDEGEYPCQSECGPGVASCASGELVGCNAPTPVPEVCNSLDDDCDGTVDEELVRACETICEAGVEFCLEGQWTGCTAKSPIPEQCNGLDDDCNNLVDDGLECACPPEMVGFLIPCMEDPLQCGQGYKTCECVDEECSTTQMTQCFAMCHWMPIPDQDCDPLTGFPTNEICNNFDEDCDQDIDEGLVAECYTGPDGTVNVGICKPGQLICNSGVWGNEHNGLFVEGMCLGEVTPLDEDLCTGNDDNCDGVLDKVMSETDILFIVDISGSMSGTINAVQQAMALFSAHYSDEEVIQWGLVVGPSDTPPTESLSMLTNLVPFQQFLPVLAGVDDESTSEEMLYDALYLSIRNLQPPQIAQPLAWSDDIASSPTIDNWHVNWRPDAHHVVILFSDEDGQSFTIPETDQQKIIDAANNADDLFIYTFSGHDNRNGPWGWEPVSLFGGWASLTANSNQMFGDLMGIINETACGADGVQMGYRRVKTIYKYAAQWRVYLKPDQHESALETSWMNIRIKQCIHPIDSLQK